MFLKVLWIVTGKALPRMASLVVTSALGESVTPIWRSSSFGRMLATLTVVAPRPLRLTKPRKPLKAFANSGGNLANALRVRIVPGFVITLTMSRVAPSLPRKVKEEAEDEGDLVSPLEDLLTGLRTALPRILLRILPDRGRLTNEAALRRLQASAIALVPNLPIVGDESLLLPLSLEARVLGESQTSLLAFAFLRAGAMMTTASFIIPSLAETG